MERFAAFGFCGGSGRGLNERTVRCSARFLKVVGGNYTLIEYLPASCGVFSPSHWRYACLRGRIIQLNVIDHKGLHVQAMALDCRTILGPYVPVASVDTLRRMLVYLGATPEQLEAFNRSYRRWGQGTARITLLPGRKNLLRLRVKVAAAAIELKRGWPDALGEASTASLR